MPTGRTRAGVDASGGIVLIYNKTGPKQFITGEETSYVTDNKNIVKFFRTAANEDIYAAFLAPEASQKAAEAKFARSCEELEDANRVLGRVSYGNVKQSSKKGFLSAKPRYVEFDRRGKYGFPKGSYETTDASVDEGALREVSEEIGLSLDPSRLVDVHKTILMGGKSNYAVFHYELTDAEQTKIKADLVKKNKDRYSELHSIQFRAIPKNHETFFTNMGSRKAYEQTINAKQGGTRRTRRRRSFKARY
jgi:8-oxo-dGTP pyrophosphatase MutT (NUDIX family)